MKLEKNVCMENLQRKKNLRRQKFPNSTQTGITKAHKKTLPAEAVKTISFVTRLNSSYFLRIG